jgi:hypothetical protein
MDSVEHRYALFSVHLQETYLSIVASYDNCKNRVSDLDNVFNGVFEQVLELCLCVLRWEFYLVFCDICLFDKVIFVITRQPLCVAVFT